MLKEDTVCTKLIIIDEQIMGAAAKEIVAMHKALALHVVNPDSIPGTIKSPYEL